MARKGLLQAALNTGAKVTVKKKGKPAVSIAKPKEEKRAGKGLDAYSGKRKRALVNKDKRKTPRKTDNVLRKKKGEILTMYKGQG